MLHDPGHIEPPEIAEEIVLEQFEKDILRGLADEWIRIASLPVHQENARLWQKLNDLDSERPMVWINEIPWHEMNYQDELTLRCENEWARYNAEKYESRLSSNTSVFTMYVLTFASPPPAIAL